MKLCSCEKWNILNHSISRFGNQEFKLFKGPSILMWNKIWESFIWSNFLANAWIYCAESLSRIDPLEETKRPRFLKGELRYGRVRGREMHLREGAEDEWLNITPSLQAVSLRDQPRILREREQNRIVLSFTHQKQEFNCNFTYSNMSTTMQLCFQKTHKRHLRQNIFHPAFSPFFL